MVHDISTTDISRESWDLKLERFSLQAPKSNCVNNRSGSSDARIEIDLVISDFSAHQGFKIQGWMEAEPGGGDSPVCHEKVALGCSLGIGRF